MLHPGTIAAQQQRKQKTTAVSAKAPSKDIWADDEVMESEAVLVADADLDTRQRPEYDTTQHVHGANASVPDSKSSIVSA